MNQEEYLDYISLYLESVVVNLERLSKSNLVPDDVENRILWATNDLHNLKALIESNHLKKHEKE